MDTPSVQPNCLTRLVAASASRLALPIAVYPGLALTGATVRDVVSSTQAQYEAQLVLHERYRTRVVLTAMDLSAEAEAFGCEIHLSDTEIPTVTGRRVTNQEEARALAVPKPGDGRTGIYLETARRLRQLPDRSLVLGGCIGPFSLAARLAGVSEALELTLAEPELMHRLLEKSTLFLLAYAQAFRAAGADGLLMAEPAAGLLSPRGMSAFSSTYIRRIVEALNDGHFALVLHNCAAKLVHLSAMLEAGTSICHVGAPMDLPAALSKTTPGIVLCGNLDPSAVFCQAAPAEVRSRTQELLAATKAFPNFIVSSGCDVPPGAPLANLDAFYAAVGGAKA